MKYEVECDWREIGSSAQRYVPQLNFYMPLAYQCSSYRYDVPAGTIERKGMGMDVPGLSWALGVREEQDKKAVMLMTDTKYGFRGVENSLAISLIRSSFDPDPTPEFGMIRFRFAVGLVQYQSNADLFRLSYDYNHPMSILSGVIRKGRLPASSSLISLQEGTVSVSAIKLPEAGNKDRLIIRVFETDGVNTRVVLRFFKKALSAWYVDINEKTVETGLDIATEGQKVSFEVEPYSFTTICVRFD
jgi:alpha-mannosidase